MVPLFSNRRASLWSAGICLLVGAAVFQWFGNGTHGYIHTSSLFYWWGAQWFDPASEAEHGPLIVAVAVWLFWRNVRNGVDGSARTPRPPLGKVSDPPLSTFNVQRSTSIAAPTAMLVGLGLHLLGYAVQQPRVSILALLVFGGGVTALAGGRRWLRAAIFPLGFALLAVPINFLDTAGLYLQMAVTRSTYELSHAAGIAVMRNGAQLFAPDGRYQYDVAAACSGVRSLVALLGLAVLIGYLQFRDWWWRTLVVVLGVTFVVLGNVLRVTSIIMISEKFGRASGERWHAWSGFFVFALVLGLLLAAVKILKTITPETNAARDLENAETPRPLKVSAESTPTATRWEIAAVVAVTAGLVSWATTRLDVLPLGARPGVRIDAAGVNPVDLPAFLGSEWIGRRAEVTAVERNLLPADTGYARRTYVELAHPENEVLLSVVLSGRDRTSIHRPELCLVGQGWTIVGRFEHRFTLPRGRPLPMTVLRIVHEDRAAAGQPAVERGLLVYSFVGDGEIEPTYRGMLWRGALDRLRRLRASRWAYVLAQTHTADSEEAALARLSTVLGALDETLLPLR